MKRFVKIPFRARCLLPVSATLSSVSHDFREQRSVLYHPISAELLDTQRCQGLANT